MAKIERCYGISTGLGYLVGAGGNGKTKELDDLVQKAAVLLKEKLGVNITIRFNTDRRSGGAFVQDGEMSSKIGITAGLYNTAFRKMNLPIIRQQIRTHTLLLLKRFRSFRSKRFFLRIIVWIFIRRF